MAGGEPITTDEIKRRYVDYKRDVVGDKEPTEAQMKVMQGIADRLLERKGHVSDDVRKMVEPKPETAPLPVLTRAKAPTHDERGIPLPPSHPRLLTVETAEPTVPGMASVADSMEKMNQAMDLARDWRAGQDIATDRLAEAPGARVPQEAQSPSDVLEDMRGAGGSLDEDEWKARLQAALEKTGQSPEDVLLDYGSVNTEGL
jgi:hypothetical protein